jgi:hypothetical protein
MKSKTKYSANRSYSATYQFLSDNENVITLKTTFSGASILRFGLKGVIYHHAKRLKLPKGYLCSVDD